MRPTDLWFPSSPDCTPDFKQTTAFPKCAGSMKNTPRQELLSLAKQWGLKPNTIEFARRLDCEDPLRAFRERFNIPKMADVSVVDPQFIKVPGQECIYLCGHSLGLKPKAADGHVQKVLDNWGKTGAECHVHGYLPAATCDLYPRKLMADIVGADPDEIVFMNGLTVNLHLLMMTYYRPQGKRCKMVIESYAFPSDMYAAQSQVAHHGLDVASNLLILKPRQGEQLLREEDIYDLIEKEGDSIALLLLPGVQYYTGQVFDVPGITNAARKKYMNSGPGSIGVAYISHKFRKACERLPELRGWWGNNIETKFLMRPEFDPCLSADVFKLSNGPPLLIATVMASLEMFAEVKESDRLHKQFLLTGYFELLMIDDLGASHDITDRTQPFHILTPSDTTKRGSQLSIHLAEEPKFTHQELQRRGILCDLRMPSVVRLAPMPMYNTYEDVYNCIQALREICANFPLKKTS
ncbi:kynureninase-like isoform X5 [Dermacentor albipictus]|uniref:kynureninase-like isoform X5 n=1 Tax=Dermacentor albipictus TaxID=60249 RepID=UPI0031FC958C